MKKPMLLIVLLAIAVQSNSQCLSYEYLSSKFELDLEKQYESLKAEGFKMTEGLKTENSIEWFNDKSGQYINISYHTSSPEIKKITYQMIEDEDCYNKLKARLSTLGYEKDTEKVVNSGLNFYYVSDTNGAVMSKIPGDGFTNHIFELYDLNAYYLLFK